MTIINLTQHNATASQAEAVVVDLAPSEKAKLVSLITFNTLPTREELVNSANAVAILAVASGCQKAMIGGAGFFMGLLENSLLAVGIEPLHAFSVRESVETTNENGDVVKTNVFKHVGFVSASP